MTPSSLASHLLGAAKPSDPPAGPRWLSLLEAAAASLIVAGHNVWRLVPNEVPILAVLGLVSFRLRNGGWRAMGFGRPKSWGRTLLYGLAAAIALQSISQFVTDPLLKPFLHYSSEANPFKGVAALPVALQWLALVWSFAAFGEEIGYRGYLLNRTADTGGGGRLALTAALVWTSAMFGLGHWYQGPAGVGSTAVDGLVLGAAYLLSGRNLWVAILAHGISDTFAVVVVALGWAN